MNTKQRLFVYGSLAPGRANHEVLECISGIWEEATLRGTLVEEGWGSALGCPGIIPTPNGKEVKGFLFSSDQIEDHWLRLDAFEGDGYKRISVTVRVCGTHDVKANVYALNRDA